MPRDIYTDAGRDTSGYIRTEEVYCTDCEHQLYLKRYYDGYLETVGDVTQDSCSECGSEEIDEREITEETLNNEGDDHGF